MVKTMVVYRKLWNFNLLWKTGTLRVVDGGLADCLEKYTCSCKMI